MKYFKLFCFLSIVILSLAACSASDNNDDADNLVQMTATAVEPPPTIDGHATLLPVVIATQAAGTADTPDITAALNGAYMPLSPEACAQLQTVLTTAVGVDIEVMLDERPFSTSTEEIGMACSMAIQSTIDIVDFYDGSEGSVKVVLTTLLAEQGWQVGSFGGGGGGASGGSFSYHQKGTDVLLFTSRTWVDEELAGQCPPNCDFTPEQTNIELRFSAGQRKADAGPAPIIFPVPGHIENATYGPANEACQQLKNILATTLETIVTLGAQNLSTPTNENGLACMIGTRMTQAHFDQRATDQTLPTLLAGQGWQVMPDTAMSGGGATSSGSGIYYNRGDAFLLLSQSWEVSADLAAQCPPSCDFTAEQRIVTIIISAAERLGNTAPPPPDNGGVNSSIYAPLAVEQCVHLQSLIATSFNVVGTMSETAFEAAVIDATTGMPVGGPPETGTACKIHATMNKAHFDQQVSIEAFILVLAAEGWQMIPGTSMSGGGVGGGGAGAYYQRGSDRMLFSSGWFADEELAGQCPPDCDFLPEQVTVNIDIAAAQRVAGTSTNAGDTITFTVQNNSSVAICDLLIGASAGQGFENDLLGETSLLAGDVIAFNMAKGEYNLAVVDCNGGSRGNGSNLIMQYDFNWVIN